MPGPGRPRVTLGDVSEQRYRCNGCGNVTRFNVTAVRRTRAFHHYDLGGELAVEEEVVEAETIESVECRWCGTGSHVELVAVAGARPLTGG